MYNHYLGRSNDACVYLSRYSTQFITGDIVGLVDRLIDMVEMLLLTVPSDSPLEKNTEFDCYCTCISLLFH